MYIFRYKQLKGIEMATHKVIFEAPHISVTKKDYIFHIKRGGTKLGKLKVSTGAIVFVPSHGGVRKQWKLGWNEFAEIAKAKGRKVKK
jgi:hypothetical protein